MNFTLTSQSAEDTKNLANKLAPLLVIGDVLLLHGPVGAGKTDLARKIIQNQMRLHNVEEDVPSPTFTLVQTYEIGNKEFLHADLYRLSHPDEVYELGIERAFEEAICLIEWPNRLGSIAPNTALNIKISILDDDTRRFKFYWSDPACWDKIKKLSTLNLSEQQE